MNDLEGRVALITGASRGIGEATARELGRRGVRVVLAARSTTTIESVAEDIRGDGGEAAAVPCDVSRYPDLVAAVDCCLTTFGTLDILVNNAGVIEPIARLADSEPEQWDQVVDINLKGVYHGLRAAIPVMAERGTGTIVNLSSGAATSALEGWSHYCATKAAVASLTRCADKEYRDRGVRVVGLSPGTVATDMQTAIRASGVNPVSRLDPSAHIPPAWAARAIAWLCTAAAGEFRGTDFALNSAENRRRVGIAG